MNDWRVGRLMSVNVVPYDSASGIVGTLPPNRNRVGLWIRSSILWTAVQGCKVTFTNGVIWNMSAYQQELKMSLANDGPQLQYGFTISVISGAQTGTIVETILPESYLAAGLKQYESELARAGIPGY
jgi:hypothetical protein